MLAYFCKHRFLLSLFPAIPPNVARFIKRRSPPSPSPYALKGQKLLAQGIALGNHDASLSPCKGKSFHIPDEIQSFCPYRATY